MPFPEIIYNDASVVDALFARAFWLTTVTFTIVILILLYFLVRYRERHGHKAYYTHGNTKGATTLTLCLAMLVFFGIDVHLALYDIAGYEKLFAHMPEESEAVNVQVFAEQFAWNFRYAGKDEEFGTSDDITKVGELHVPKGQQVLLHMKSKDVIHSLFLPQLRIKQDVVPGLKIKMWFQADKSTAAARQEKNNDKFNFEIACAELCGLGHGRMAGQLIVHEADEYPKWIEQESANAGFFIRAEVWKYWGDKPAKKEDDSDFGDDDDDDDSDFDEDNDFDEDEPAAKQPAEDDDFDED